MDLLMFGKKLRKVLEVGIKIFVAVKSNNDLTGLRRDSSCGFSAAISMDKEFLALLFVTRKHTVDVSACTVKG